MRSTQRWSAEESGVAAPGLAGPRRRRAEASTPGTTVGCITSGAGAQANAIALTAILTLSGIIPKTNKKPRLPGVFWLNSLCGEARRAKLLTYWSYCPSKCD